jgi:hypothetical protein
MAGVGAGAMMTGIMGTGAATRVTRMRMTTIMRRDWE